MLDPVPSHLTSALSPFTAPIMSLRYTGDTPDVSISAGKLLLADGAETLEIILSGKTASEVAGEVTKSSLGYRAHVLFDAADMGAIGLTTDPDDLTTDGAQLLRADGHVFKNLEETRLRLLRPYNEDRHMPWHVRVDRGTTTRLQHGGTWLFSVPEYDSQPWSLLYGKPYMDQRSVRATRIGRKAISVPRTPIYWRHNNLVLHVRGIEQPASVILDVDERNGIIFLNANYDEDEVILVDHTYEERSLIYQGVDLNPTEFHNPGVLDRYVVFYMLPWAGPDGRIRSDTVRHSESSTLLGALMSIPRTEEPFLVLGAAQVRQVGSISDVEVTDTRTWGGGVKKDILDAAARRMEDVRSTTDHGHYDGTPYPGNAAIVVELPDELRQTLEMDEIQRLVRKHVAYGSYVILEFRQ